MVVLAGLDLAWTDNHNSGICLLRADGLNGPVELLKLEARTDTVAGFVDELLSLGPDVVAAVDAPLLRREGCIAERELARSFGRYKAGAYLASVAFLESRKPPLTAGLRLGDALRAADFAIDPLALAAGSEGRFAFETYPHAFHVAAFGLVERLRYKKGRRANRLLAFGEYQAALRLLTEGLAPGVCDAPEAAAVLHSRALEARGAALKVLEDKLDALTCALAALVAWRNGIQPADVFGDAVSGYIAIPGLHANPRFMARSQTG